MSALLLALGIAAAGAIGALLRFWVQRIVRDSFLALLVVNLAGSLWAGLVAGLGIHWFPAQSWSLPAEWVAILIVGIAGALTTFGSWTVLEVTTPVDKGRRAARLAAMVLGTVFAALLGLGLAAGMYGLFR